IALPAEAGEHPVLDLNRILRTSVRVARYLGTLERPAGLERAVVRRDLAGPGSPEPALADALQHLGVWMDRRALALAVDQDQELLARRHRLRFGDHLGHRDHARLRAE